MSLGFKCPDCSVAQKFAGACSSCSKKRRAVKAAENKASKPKRAEIKRGSIEQSRTPLKRSGRVKAKSDKRSIEDAALKAIKVILGPFVRKCLRCERPNPAGSGFLSSTNPAGLEFHHVFRRRGWFFFLGIPVCNRCHEEIEQDGNQARVDRWIVKDPIKRQ